MTQPRLTPNLFETMLANRSAVDRAFRQALFADPKATLAAELGVELPATLRVTVVEAGGDDGVPPSALDHSAWCCRRSPRKPLSRMPPAAGKFDPDLRRPLARIAGPAADNPTEGRRHGDLGIAPVSAHPGPEPAVAAACRLKVNP